VKDDRTPRGFPSAFPPDDVPDSTTTGNLPRAASFEVHIDPGNLLGCSPRRPRGASPPGPAIPRPARTETISCDHSPLPWRPDCSSPPRRSRRPRRRMHHPTAVAPANSDPNEAIRPSDLVAARFVPRRVTVGTGPSDSSAARVRACEPDVPACSSVAGACDPDVPACSSAARACEPVVPECSSAARACEPVVPGCSSVARACGPDVPGCSSGARACEPDASGCSSVARACEPDAPGCSSGARACGPAVPKPGSPADSRGGAPVPVSTAHRPIARPGAAPRDAVRVVVTSPGSDLPSRSTIPPARPPMPRASGGGVVRETRRIWPWNGRRYRVRSAASGRR